MTGILQAILSFFGVQASSSANYIEDVFSTYLYTGTGSSQTITNNIDTTTYGGLVWIKGRSGATGHRLTDTARGTTKSLESNSAAAEATESTGLTAFGTTGFTIGADADYNTNTATYVSWAFRKQAKFFDVVTYTGNGTAGRTIPHNLGSVPGCIIVKNISSGTASWEVYHRSAAAAGFTAAQSKLTLNSTAAVTDDNQAWNGTAPTSTVFSVGDGSRTNQSGSNYVAYLFAHDAGGFGAAGTDNVISCGSYTGNGSATGPVVTLGYEPQWVLVKRTTDGIEDWEIYDNMRGIVPAGADQILYPNQSSSEQSATRIQISATGFSPDGTAGSVNASGKTYIYIAIRRGPMKTPTSGTSVFSPNLETTSASAQTLTTNFPVDLTISTQRNKSIEASTYAIDRLRGTQYAAGCKQLSTNSTAAEYSWTSSVGFGYDNNTGIKDGYWPNVIGNPYDIVLWNFRRAPGFFDVVCYTGTGANATQTHNLGVVPELIIVKRRGATGAWPVYSSALSNTEYLVLNTTAAKATGTTYWNSTAPTSTVFSLGTAADVNASTAGNTYVAYLFATVTGVSKVGSYTGTGTTLQIDCGFTGGARFVLIKRTDSTGDWYVWDSARGIVAGNDPYLLLNSTAAEVTNTDYVDAYSAGFELSSTAPAAINANGGTFIFLAIA